MNYRLSCRHFCCAVNWGACYVDIKRSASILHTIPPLVSDSETQTFPVNWNTSEVEYFARIKRLSQCTMLRVKVWKVIQYVQKTKDKLLFTKNQTYWLSRWSDTIGVNHRKTFRFIYIHLRIQHAYAWQLLTLGIWWSVPCHVLMIDCNLTELAQVSGADIMRTAFTALLHEMNNTFPSIVVSHSFTLRRVIVGFWSCDVSWCVRRSLFHRCFLIFSFSS